MLNINILEVKLYSTYLYYIISCKVFIVIVMLILTVTIFITLYLFVLAIYYVYYTSYIKKQFANKIFNII